MEVLIALAAGVLINAVSLWIAARALAGVRLERLSTAVVVVLVLALINATVEPLLVVLTLPLTLLTLGLFLAVIAALVILVADRVITGFRIKSIGWAMAVASVVGFLNAALLTLLP